MDLQGAYIQVYETCHFRSDNMMVTPIVDTVDWSVTGVFASYS